MSINEPDNKNPDSPLSLLKKIWGHNNFRPNQKEIIDTVLQKNDAVAILPTGGGKSVCYQIPALLIEGITLVVSPLIALMKDQLEFLKQHNIKAAMLSGEMNQNDIIEVFDNIKYGGVKLLYVSPERVQSTLFKSKIAEFNVGLIAVDEAHCISSWGHDFRPSYLQIAKIKELFPNTPILALTATATGKVLKEIIKNLELTEPKIYNGSFDKKNISYQIHESFDKTGDLVYELHKNKGSTIIFSRNRKETEFLSAYLNQLGFSSTFYHAKLSDEEKDKRQNLWHKEHFPIMVATNAFGMGIDKANVQNIFHLSIPESVESYYQEVGRAGRDGNESKAFLFYNVADIESNLQQFEKKIPSKAEFSRIISMLYNEFSVGTNEYREETFGFELDVFLKKYKIEKAKFSSVLHFLHQSGIVFFNSLSKNSSVQILTQTTENQFKKEKLFAVMDYFSRLENSQKTPVSIDEYLLSKQLGIRTSKLKEILNLLHKQGMIDYHQKSYATIQFLLPRSTNFMVNNKPIWTIYQEIQQMLYQRVLDINYFVQKKNICRNQLILGYFGEISQKKCGKCDVCFKQNLPVSTKSLKNEIISCVAKESVSLQFILNKLNHCSKEKIIESIEELIQQKKIKRSNLNYFHL